MLKFDDLKGKLDDIPDIARSGIQLFGMVKEMQSSLLAVMECRVPVIVGVHNGSVGGSVDLMSMCDIRYCTEDA